jgi:hypothetical protein
MVRTICECRAMVVEVGSLTIPSADAQDEPSRPSPGSPALLRLSRSERNGDPGAGPLPRGWATADGMVRRLAECGCDRDELDSLERRQ